MNVVGVPVLVSISVSVSVSVFVSVSVAVSMSIWVGEESGWMGSGRCRACSCVHHGHLVHVRTLTCSVFELCLWFAGTIGGCGQGCGGGSSEAKSAGGAGCGREESGRGSGGKEGG